MRIDDDEREFPPGAEAVYPLDRVMADLDNVERLLGVQAGVPATGDQRRKLRAILDRMITDVDQLFDIATVVAHGETKLGTTN